MPGESHQGALPALDSYQRALAGRLRANVEHLAVRIGERNATVPKGLAQARDYLGSQLDAIGVSHRLERFDVGGREVANVIAEFRGSRGGAASDAREPIVVVGAHYDSAVGTPGANDNATGCAVLLELARTFAASAPARTLRLVWFVNEEPPYFNTDDMGSFRHARGASERGEAISAMLSLESLGYYTQEPGSQRYPSSVLGALYPEQGNFVSFVGNTESRTLVRRAVRVFRKTTAFPSEGLAAPTATPGIDWSDHGSFWKFKIPAIMVTDTAHFRDPHYHAATDGGQQVDYERMARVAQGVEAVTRDLTTRSR
jgi:Zn-dependent M28 family amino/carboxypeptidase